MYIRAAGRLNKKCNKIPHKNPFLSLKKPEK
jgi:hypothetical protein